MTYSMKRLAPVLILPLILLALLLGTANVFAADTPAEAAATRAEAREQAAAEKDARSRDDDDEDDEDDLQVVEEDDEDDEGDEDDDADADDDEDEGIAFEKTPEAVQATIKKVFGDDPDIEEIGRDEDDGEVFYYVGGETSDGEFVELTISGDGQIHEQEIELDDAPEAIKATVMKVAGATDLAEADLDDVEGRKIVEEGQTHYHFELETGDGSRVGLEMAEDGTIIVREQSIEPENLPADIQKLVKVEVGDAAEIEEAYKIEEADEGARFVVIGEIEDKEFELLASADGSEVEVEVFTEGDDDDDEEDEDDDNEDDDDEEDEDEGDDLEDDEEDED